MREWLARWLGVGKAQRLRAETQAEALTTAYRHKLVTELHNLKILDGGRDPGGFGRGEREEEGEGRMEEALSSLDDRSRVPQLLALLKDKKLDPPVSGRIIEALSSLGDDRATVEGLAALLDREDIGSRVYEALFHVSRRAGMRVFARKGGGYEVRPLAYVQEG